MGPWNEDTQLQRMETVRLLLDRPGISGWAKDYWTSVLNRMATNEDRYNARVVGVYKEIQANEIKD